MKTGEQNHQWKGGRVLASNGYVLIRVGVDHHLADVRGYAYEHRLVAEQKLGRRLEPGEIVHHEDEDKTNNAPDNLTVCQGNAEHLVHHRSEGSRRRLPGEDNPLLPCACGCGAEVRKYDSAGRPREYIAGHNPQPAPLEAAVKAVLAAHSPMGPLAIHRLVGGNLTAIKQVLRRLKDRGTVARLGRGKWVMEGTTNG